MQEWKEKEVLTKKNLAEKRLDKKAREEITRLNTKEKQLTEDYNKKVNVIEEKYEIKKLEEQRKRLEKTIKTKKEQEEKLKLKQKADDDRIEKIELALKIKEQDKENIKFKLDEERKSIFKKIFKAPQPKIPTKEPSPKPAEPPTPFFKEVKELKNDLTTFNNLLDQTEELYDNKDKAALIKIYKQARDIYLTLSDEEKKIAHNRLSNIYIKIKTL